MKSVLIIPDGAADRKVPGLGNKTPLEAAHMPTMKSLASKSEIGLASTIPDGLHPGTDVGCSSLLGYDPRKYYPKRGPLEAAFLDVPLQDTDTAFRCNLVTIEDNIMKSFTSDHISTPEADELLQTLNDEITDDTFTFYTGIMYRHLMVYHGDFSSLKTAPCHNFVGKPIDGFLPEGKNSEIILKISRDAHEILKDHPVNKKRIEKGLLPANHVWIWGNGENISYPSFQSRFNVTGGIVTAVGLLRGLAKLIGLDVIDIPHITGYIDTPYEDKVAGGIACLQKHDFLCIHIAGIDETGHEKNPELKVKALEDFDMKVVQPLLEGLENMGEPYRVLICPDHATPCTLGYHTSEPVPYLFYDSQHILSTSYSFSEKDAEKNVSLINEGWTLIQKLFT
ncbi:cofactor-independent phosphoglycerate mutase [Candidatus Margulisiibacteriota bacterium]